MILSGADAITRIRQAPGFAPVVAPPAEVGAPAIPPAAVRGGPQPAVDPLAAPAWKSSAGQAPAAPTAAIPPAEHAVTPAPPATSLSPIPATTTVPGVPSQLTGDDFVTVQWIETHIGTLCTWVPQTETFHFEAMSQAPLPGAGSIGMGTLTGKTGHTQTI
jgi:hypothetical protein